MLVLGAPAGGAIVICGATMCVCCRRPLHDCFSHQRAQQDSRRQAKAFTSRCAHLHYCLTSAKKPAKLNAARLSRDALVPVDTPLQLYHSHFCCCRGPSKLTAGSSAGHSSARNGGAGRTNHGLAPQAKLELIEAIQDLIPCIAATSPGAIKGQSDLAPCESKAAAVVLLILLSKTQWSQLQRLLQCLIPVRHSSCLALDCWMHHATAAAAPHKIGTLEGCQLMCVVTIDLWAAAGSY